MTNPDIISHVTTQELRYTTEDYALVCLQPPRTMREVDGFAQLYLGRPGERFATRFTPNIVGEYIGHAMVGNHVDSIAVGIDDLEDRQRANMQIEFGQGYEPAVIVAPVIHHAADISTTRRTACDGVMVRALTEAEGQGLKHDLFVAMKLAARNRRSFWRR